MLPSGRSLALALTVDGEVELVAGMVDLLGGIVDRVVLVEGRTTFHGDPRDVVADRWSDLIALPDGVLRSVVIDLPDRDAAGVGLRRREMLQRSAIALGVRDMAACDLVLAVDADEFVDPAWVVAEEMGIDSPQRLPLVPMYGGLDRRAPDWHCCREHLALTPGSWPTPATDFLFPGGVIGPVADLAGRGTHDWRATAQMATAAAGWHLLHVLPADSDPARKHSRQAHVWDTRVDTGHMRRAIEAGIHPYGWWSASPMDVPHELGFLADRHREVVVGPLPDEAYRESLMARWWLDFRGRST